MGFIEVEAGCFLIPQHIVRFEKHDEHRLDIYFSQSDMTTLPLSDIEAVIRALLATELFVLMGEQWVNRSAIIGHYKEPGNPMIVRCLILKNGEEVVVAPEHDEAVQAALVMLGSDL